MLKRRSETQSAHADFVPNWRADLPDTIAQHERLGSLQHVVIYGDRQQPLYDSPLWIERTGAVCVTVDQEDRVVMLRQLSTHRLRTRKPVRILAD